jgi:patatin-like phospholipase/acyl hydrolase
MSSLRILSFDGGGSRCIFSLKILETILIKLYGCSDDKATKFFLRNFDIIAGTSGGSIIASLLVTGHSCDNIKKMFYDFGTKVFVDGWLGYPYKILRYMKSGDYYPPQVLDQYLAGFFNDRNIGTILKKLMIVSTNATSNVLSPYIFRSYRFPADPETFEGSNDELLRNCIRASTAAPTYFSPYVDTKGNKFIDGGLVANNPTKIAILELEELYPGTEINLILSIGTGTVTPTKGSTSIKNLPGEVITLVTNSDLIHHEVIQWLYDFSRDTKYFRFSPDGLGSVKMDTSNETILMNGEIETEKYMNKISTEVDKLINSLKIGL